MAVWPKTFWIIEKPCIFALCIKIAKKPLMIFSVTVVLTSFIQLAKTVGQKIFVVSILEVEVGCWTIEERMILTKKPNLICNRQWFS